MLHGCGAADEKGLWVNGNYSLIWVNSQGINLDLEFLCRCLIVVTPASEYKACFYSRNLITGSISLTFCDKMLGIGFDE